MVDEVSRRFALAERSVFEDTSQYEEHCVVASIGGNTGNQTMALVIRALALDTVQPSGTG